MSVDVRRVASALRGLADEIATHDRPVSVVEWYVVNNPSARVGAMPVVSMAIHDALCTGLAVLIADDQRELVVCDRCNLAVENGAM